MVARDRRPGPARAPSTRPPRCGWSAPSWPCSASASAPPCRTWCCRCRTTPPSPTWARPARSSRSSASMGGSVGVSALGAVLSHQVADKVAEGLAAMGVAGDAAESHVDPRPGRAARRRSGRSSSRPSARRPATSSWWRCRSRCWRSSACCSSARCRCAPRSCATTSSHPRRPPRLARRAPMTTRRAAADALRRLEREVGVMVRRVRRVIGAARPRRPPRPAAGVVPDADLPRRARPAARLGRSPTSSASTRARSAARSSTSSSSGCWSGSADPDDGRAMLVSLSDDARTRLDRRRASTAQVPRRAARRLVRRRPDRLRRASSVATTAPSEPATDASAQPDGGVRRAACRRRAGRCRPAPRPRAAGPAACRR